MPVDAIRQTVFDPDLNMTRQSLYRFTSLCLLDPRHGCWEQLNSLRESPLLQATVDFVRNCLEAKAQKMGRGEHPIECLEPRNVLCQLPDSPAALNEEYERTFGLLASNACPPYETEYINSKFTFQRSSMMADLGGFCHAFGLTGSTAHPERPDHIVLELEFMAFLLGLERRGAEEGPSKDNECLKVCRGAQKRFLTDHLAWWTPAFARLLGRENRDGFYAATGVFLASLIPAERAIMNVSLVESEVQPSLVERPEECSHCLAGADLS